MSLTPELVAEITRQRLGLPDASQSARIIFQIPECLKLTARKIAANPHLRHLLITDKKTTILPIDTFGKVNLAAGYTSFNFLLEYLDCGQMYLDDATYPLQKSAVYEANLPDYLSGFNYYYIEGDYLFVKDVYEGSVYFAVPYFPQTLGDLPESGEAERIFLDKMFEMFAGQDAEAFGEN